MSERSVLKVVRVRAETERVKSIWLQRDGGGCLPQFKPGAHIDVRLPNGLTRQYSLLNDPIETDCYARGVQCEPEGRGGSAWIHAELTEGGTLEVGWPRNNFPLARATRYLLIGGGIGVTPLISMGAYLHRTGAAFDLYYCTRGAAETAFLERIEEAGWRDRVVLVHDGGNPARGLDVRQLLCEHASGTHLYCCGPAALLHAVREASAHWPDGTVHFESFSAEPDLLNGAEDRPFTVVLARSDLELAVPADKSIADVLIEHRIPVATSCREGVCGTCITEVIAGEPEHRDSILTDEEHESNKLVTVCCSRAKGARLVIDL